MIYCRLLKHFIRQNGLHLNGLPGYKYINKQFCYSAHLMVCEINDICICDAVPLHVSWVNLHFPHEVSTVSNHCTKDIKVIRITFT